MSRPQTTRIPSSIQEPAPTGYRFLRRLTLAVMVGYLLTMLVFVAVSFAAERRMYYTETYQHLDETLRVLASVLNSGSGHMENALRKAELALEQQTKAAHRVMVVDREGRILATGHSNLMGRFLPQVFSLRPYASSDRPWRHGRTEAGRWLASSIPLSGGAGGSQLVLLRSGQNIDQFVRMFMKFHGLHLVITALVFLLLFKVIGRRFVREPLRSLISLIHDVESGKLTARPSQDLEDELAWMGRRFSHMGHTLQETIEQLVRAEKYAAVSMVAFRAAREMQVPLEAMNRHILYLEGLAENDINMRVIGSSLREDRHHLLNVLARLKAIEPPESGDANSVAQPVS